MQTTIILQIGAIILLVVIAGILVCKIMSGLLKIEKHYFRWFVVIIVCIVVLIDYHKIFSGLVAWQMTDIVSLEYVSVTEDANIIKIGVSEEKYMHDIKLEGKNENIRVFYLSGNVTIEENINCIEPILIVYTRKVLGEKEVKLELIIPAETVQNEVILN